MNFLTTTALRTAALGAIFAFATAAQAQTITGAGASFPAPVYAKWADAYKKDAGVSVNYQSIGSGGGIKQIKAGTVVFGASDSPLKPDDLQKSGLVQFPTVMGGVVPVINLEGIKSGGLVLDGKTLADIFLGKITSWNDPAIQKLNPDVKLPDQAIAVVRRSDGSGTNFLFTDYLSKVNPEFKEKVGAATSVEWPVGLGAKGNEGVANSVKQTSGAIGYVEFAYAEQNKLPHVSLINAAGKKVEPTMDAFRSAASSADWASAPGYYLILTNQKGEGSWPITGATFILMHKQPKDAAATREALKFFDWAYKSGDDMAEALDYVPMPDNVVEDIHKTWTQSIQDSGKPVYGG